MADQDLPNLSKDITLLPEDIRADLAERGRNDLYFFAKAIMGYRDMTPSCHLPLCMFLDQHPSRFKMVLMPRGHFKTSVCTISRVSQLVCRDPNQRILLANETSTNAERFLSAIKQNFESNKVLRALYSSIIPKDTRRVRWSSNELEFVREWKGPEPTVDTVGMTGAMTSRHFTHITVDDPISEEAAKSDAVMSDTISRIDKMFSLMVKPEEDTFDLIGTRWSLHDVYSFFIKALGPKLARFARAAIKDGEPIFPELISLDTLAQIRGQIGEYMFSCLYMNNPRDIANQDFNVQDLRFWRWTSDEEGILLYNPDGTILREVAIDQLDVTVSVDLAVAEKISDDRNAIVTVGVTPCGNAVVLDTWVKRCTPLEVIQRLLWLRQRYSPRAVGIESVAYQKAFKYFLKAECERRGVYMNIQELKAIPSKRGMSNNSKEARIRGLQPIVATGRLYIRPDMHELRNEMADFPLGEHDDCLDSLAHQLTMWRSFMSPERWSQYKVAEEALLQNIDGYGTRVPLSYSNTERKNDPFTPHPDDLGIELPQFSPWEDYTERDHAR